jgi:single-stranded-DNA-specific exonuclease
VLNLNQLVERPYDVSVANQLMAEGLHPALSRVYVARGVTHKQQLEGALSGMLHYRLLKNIEAMAQRLADAVQAGERVVVIADYDADGATACAVAVRGLNLLGLPIRFWVPNRFIHGYGLTSEIVRMVAAWEEKPEIILTVDNGMSSYDGVETARELGMEVLITDHHLPGEQVPDTLIVNPNQTGCPFQSKHLAGVGVMFYVLLATRAELQARGVWSQTPVPNLAQLLDLVALGTVADVVKLDENNRILVEQGLRRIRQKRACAGVNALFAVAGRQLEQASTSDLGFMIGPRLNAAGRLEDMSQGIACLLSDEEDDAAQLALRLHDLNAERRGIEAAMQEQVQAALQDDVDPASGYSMAVYDPTWHAGVVGILASRLKERYHRPVICFARGQGDEIKGSGRSIPGLHLRDALDWVSKQVPGLILKFGGHSAAAGLSISEFRFKEFVVWFEQAAQTFLTPQDLQTSIWTDGELAAVDMTPDLAQAIAEQVWGQGFPPPSFYGVFRVAQQRVLKEKHLKLRLSQGMQQWNSILFNCNETLPETIHAVYQLDWNCYRDSAEVQLRISDWCAASD